MDLRPLRPEAVSAAGEIHPLHGLLFNHAALSPPNRRGLVIPVQLCQAALNAGRLCSGSGWQEMIPVRVHTYRTCPTTCIMQFSTQPLAEVVIFACDLLRALPGCVIFVSGYSDLRAVDPHGRRIPTSATHTACGQVFAISEKAKDVREVVATLNARRCGGGVLRAAADSPTLCEERELHPSQGIMELREQTSFHTTGGSEDRGGLSRGGGCACGGETVWEAFKEEVRHRTPSVGLKRLTSRLKLVAVRRPPSFGALLVFQFSVSVFQFSPTGRKCGFKAVKMRNSVRPSCTGSLP